MGTIPAILRHDADDVIELSKRAAHHIPRNEAVVFIETSGEDGATGFLMDEWTVVTAGHIGIKAGQTKVCLKSLDLSDLRVKATEGKAALCLAPVMKVYNTAQPINPYERIADLGLALYNPQKRWESKKDDIASGQCHGWEPFVQGHPHEDIQIFKLDRPLKVPQYLELSRRLPLGFQEWDTSILGYTSSVSINGKEIEFSGNLTQIAMKNRFFYSHYGDTFFTPFTGYDQDKPSKFDIYPYMDPLAGISGNSMSGSPLIDNTTNRVIGIISGRMRQLEGDISLNIAQPVARYYDQIKSSLGCSYK